MSVFEKILALLDSQHIVYKLTEHPPVRTSEEAAKMRGAALKTGAKAMLAEYNDQRILLVLPADRQIDWKKLRALLHVRDIHLIPREEAERLTQVEMGSVPPFGNILGLPTYVDEGLFENETINFNPGSRTHSIAMKSADFRALVSPIVATFTK